MKKMIWLLAAFPMLLFSDVDIQIAPRILQYNEEIESLCHALTLEKTDALDALQNLKKFLATEHPLNFEILNGGFNPPALISQLDGPHKIALCVLKLEQGSLQAEERMQVLDTMRNQGCDLLPRILRSQEGEYLVKLGERFYSCIEYIETAEKPPISLEQMFRLTSKFHTYSKNCYLTEAHFRPTLDWFSEASSMISNPAPPLIQRDASIFQTDSWERCVRCTHYLISPFFREIYDSLPTQLIHGDIAPHNIIFSSGKPFFIDFESMRMDTCLRDFAFSGAHFLDEFLVLLEANQLIPFIQGNYGELEANEKDYLPFIVLLERCAALAWRLQVLAQAISAQDVQKIEEFYHLVISTIDQINRISHLSVIQSQIFDIEEKNASLLGQPLDH